MLSSEDVAVGGDASAAGGLGAWADEMAGDGGVVARRGRRGRRTDVGGGEVRWDVGSDRLGGDAAEELPREAGGVGERAGQEGADDAASTSCSAAARRHSR